MPPTSSLVAAITMLPLSRHSGRLLDRCRQFVGGHLSIFSKDTGRTAPHYHDGRIDPYWAQLISSYVQLDQPMPSTCSPISTADQHHRHLRLRRVHQSRFFSVDCNRRLVDFISADPAAGGWAAMFGVFRHEKRDGLVGDATRATA
jgi:hypothetical protein